jgi:hypothetical protein
MKSTLHSPIPFLPVLPIVSDCHLPTPSILSLNCLRSSLYSLGAAPTENTAYSIVACWFTVAKMCLSYPYVATREARTTENIALLLLGAFVSTSMCLPSRCLAMNYASFQASCHNIFVKTVRSQCLRSSSEQRWIHGNDVLIILICID